MQSFRIIQNFSVCFVLNLTTLYQPQFGEDIIETKDSYSKSGAEN